MLTPNSLRPQTIWYETSHIYMYGVHSHSSSLFCTLFTAQLAELDKAITKAERDPSKFNLTVEELR